MREPLQPTYDPERTQVACTVPRDTLIQHLDGALEIGRFKDASANGLQIEGQALVSKVVVGVTANLALLEAARAAQAQLVLAHHGLFWKGDDPRIVGSLRKRVAVAINADLNVAAYHLPLDVHPVWGNNAQLALQLGLKSTATVGDYGLVNLGQLGEGLSLPAKSLAAFVARRMNSRVTLYSQCSRPVRKIAWCTGAGGSLLPEAIAAGADAYITGEISEHHIHLARESDITLLTAGHHATERGGVMALAAYITRRFGIECQFVEVDSPL